MNTKAIIGVSILAVVLIVLGSQANVVGYQTVQSSVKERLNEKDVLFQTICDLSNNKEVQKAIIESEGKFLNPIPITKSPSIPTITKKQLNFLYYFGVALSKTMSKNLMNSMAIRQPILSHQVNVKIDAIIRSDAKLSEDMKQLSNLDCNCNDETSWPFPVICTVLNIINIADWVILLSCQNIIYKINHFIFILLPALVFFTFAYLGIYIVTIGNHFNCDLWEPDILPG